ncbi:hypothetical protein [Roseibium aggregatum]|uniref:Uncharacterized protein n=1 Tax=Roseibium aggregatum TaxID=187304 RepID=A0A926S8E2_9HYPH|nr:hypothetical protein [Roseibium aggregatum]MBD1548602.1 hypothetical protein [Roseibium aggregatum]
MSIDARRDAEGYFDFQLAALFEGIPVLNDLHIDPGMSRNKARCAPLVHRIPSEILC